MRDGFRVGIGYDVHRLVEGRRLVIGGVEIDHDRGLDGHSDADVLTHAVIDAILGASGGGDIGTHFPPDDERWRDADSIDLLRQVLRELNVRVVNVDVTVVAEEPRLGPHREAIERRLADAIDGAVSVKATTNERLGSIGAGEGIAAHAVALVDLAGASARRSQSD